MTSLEENILSSAESIVDVEIKNKIISAISSLDVPSKIPIVTDAIKTIRKKRDHNLYKIARDIASLAYVKYPTNPYIVGELCIVKLFLNETNELIQIINQFIDNVRKNGTLLKESEIAYLSVTQAHAYSHQGEIDKGISVLEKLNSDSPNVLEALGELYYQQNNYNKTIELLGNRDNISVKMARWLAKSYIRKGDINTAQDILRKFDENKKLKDVYNELFQERGVVNTSNFVQSANDSNIKIFVSHASKDKELAKKLQRLLRDSLGIDKSRIRCTSIAGSRLPVGAETPQQLAKDIINAQVFIGLITEHSVQSDYVLFELGAAWIVDHIKNKHITIPLLGNGVSYEILPGLFKQKNAVKVDDLSQVQQLLEEVADFTGIKLLDPSNYQDELNDFCGK